MEQKEIKISLISLGCEKNLVDSEMILGMIKNSHYDFKITNNLEESDCIIINTCGFIDSAKEEAIKTIFDCIGLKEKNPNLKLVVCGCLTQRYLKDLIQNIEEVDLFIPIVRYFEFGKLLLNLFKKEDNDSLRFDYHNRLISTGKRLAYLRISDGCDNRCAYCAIPLIRGGFNSVPFDDVVKGLKKLVKDGYKEIALISQDLTRYGTDINLSLASLLKELDKIEGDHIIRLLYLYPDEITKELIETIKESNHIIHYFDIPLQHASNKILKYMRRRGTKEEYISLIKYIRSQMSDAIIRTTMIVGFPHETKKDFDELIEFVKEVEFDHLGAFMYSKEEDTPAFKMNMQVSKKEKVNRYNILLEEQRHISNKLMKKFIGNTYFALLEKYDDNEKCFLARIYSQAPDDIDGYTKIYSPNSMKDKVKLDEMCEVEIIDSTDYDLIGNIRL